MRHGREIIYLFIIMLIILTLVQTASAEQFHSMNMVRDALALAYFPMQEERVTIKFWMKSELGKSLLTEMVTNKGQSITYRAEEVREYRNGTRLIFRGWYRDSELVTTNLAISINATSNAEYYACYDVEYWIDVNLGYERISEWIKRGEELGVEVPKSKELSNNTKLIFEGWSGDFEGMNRFIKIEVYQPIKASAIWRRQYKVYIVSDPQAISEIVGGGWYDEGSEAVIRVLKPVAFLNNGGTKWRSR